jgi:hypothetical protein
LALPTVDQGGAVLHPAAAALVDLLLIGLSAYSTR